MKKIIRACTVPQSLVFVEKMLPDLKKKYEVVLLSSPGPQLDEAVVKHGVKGIAVPMERHISFKHNIVSLWRMIRVFRREKPAMVHSMTPKAGLLWRDQGTVDFPFGRRAKPSLIRFSDSRKLVTIPFNSLSSSLRDAVYDTIRDSCESGKLAVTGAEIEACKYYFAA